MGGESTAESHRRVNRRELFEDKLHQRRLSLGISEPEQRGESLTLGEKLERRSLARMQSELTDSFKRRSLDKEILRMSLRSGCIANEAERACIERLREAQLIKRQAQ